MKKVIEKNLISGLLPYLNNIRSHNDLGHPICQNLRDGLWLCDYIYHRLMKDNPVLTEIGRIIRTLFSPLHEIPYDLRPCYFEALFSLIYETTFEQLMEKLSLSVFSYRETKYELNDFFHTSNNLLFNRKIFVFV